LPVTDVANMQNPSVTFVVLIYAVIVMAECALAVHTMTRIALLLTTGAK